MKKLLLIALITMVSFSCSSDDDATGQELTEEIEEEETQENHRTVGIGEECSTDNLTQYEITQETYDEIMDLIYENPDDCLYVESFEDVNGNGFSGYVMNIN